MCFMVPTSPRTGERERAHLHTCCAFSLFLSLSLSHHHFVVVSLCTVRVCHHFHIEYSHPTTHTSRFEHLLLSFPYPFHSPLVQILLFSQAASTRHCSPSPPFSSLFLSLLLLLLLLFFSLSSYYHLFVSLSSYSLPPSLSLTHTLSLTLFSVHLSVSA